MPSCTTSCCRHGHAGVFRKVAVFANRFQPGQRRFVTRVRVGDLPFGKPIYVDPLQGKMRLWVTLGVRLAQLDTRYARPPRLRPAGGEGDWEAVEPHRLEGASFLIAVDEFAEVEVPTLAPPNRQELRKLCDEHQTKEKIVEALAAGRW